MTISEQAFDEIGLIGSTMGRPKIGVPLVGVNVAAQVLDFIAEVKLTQCYHNTESCPVQARYNFPIVEAAAVCGFEAVYEDGRVVKGVVKEKNQARKEFHEAKRSGKQTNLLEAVRRDAFSLDVGNLPVGVYVKITITYVTTLKAQDDAAAFILPTYVAPRYSPPDEGLTRKEAQALGGSSGVKLTGMSIRIDFTCLSDIKSLTCPSHQLDPTLHCGFQGKTGHVTLSNCVMDGDLIALVVEDRCHQPRAIVERSETGSLAGFVTLFPRIQFPSLKREFIFLIDRSGSMSGTKIIQTRETLMLFLRALPMDCTFNIFGFGSTYSSLFEFSTPYNDETLSMACQHALALLANMGGY